MNMILDLTLPMFCILLCVSSGIGWLGWRKFNWQVKYWVIPIFMCYLLMVVGLTLFPIYIFDEDTLSEIREGAGKYFVFYQTTPFASITKYFRTGAFLQLIGNVALVSPLVMFVEIFQRQHSKAWKVVLGTSSVSFLIEIAQLTINFATGHPSRVADVDDLFLNITGIVLTIILTRCIGKVQNIQKKLQQILYRRCESNCE